MTHHSIYTSNVLCAGVYHTTKTWDAYRQATGHANGMYCINVLIPSCCLTDTKPAIANSGGGGVGDHTGGKRGSNAGGGEGNHTGGKRGSNAGGGGGLQWRVAKHGALLCR